MNYLDLLPNDITDYIYQLAHKSKMKEVLDSYRDLVNEFNGLTNTSWEERYLKRFIIVRCASIHPSTKGLWKTKYPRYLIWQYQMEERHLYNTTTLLKYAYCQKKKDILLYASADGVKLYTSWTKKKMIDTLYNEGRLLEVVQNCVNAVSPYDMKTNVRQLLLEYRSSKEY